MFTRDTVGVTVAGASKSRLVSCATVVWLVLFRWLNSNFWLGYSPGVTVGLRVVASMTFGLSFLAGVYATELVSI